jgi:hypothetical protein
MAATRAVYPGEGWPHGGLRGLEEPGQSVVVDGAMEALEPRACVVAGAPDPLPGVPLGTIGRPADEAHGGREGEPPGGRHATCQGELKIPS